MNLILDAAINKYDDGDIVCCLKLFYIVFVLLHLSFASVEET